MDTTKLMINLQLACDQAEAIGAVCTLLGVAFDLEKKHGGAEKDTIEDLLKIALWNLSDVAEYLESLGVEVKSDGKEQENRC